MRFFRSVAKSDFFPVILVVCIGCAGGGIVTEPGIVDSAWSDGGLFEALFTCDPDEPTTGDNGVTIHLQDPGGEPLEGALLSVVPWMPSMGHGCSCDPEESEIGGGGYRVDKVRFTMPGSWELRVEVSVDGESDRIVAAVEVR